MSEMVLRVAISMWVDYVQGASPPVAWHEKDNYHHWLTTATEPERRAWLRSARVAIEAMREPTDAMREALGYIETYNKHTRTEEGLRVPGSTCWLRGIDAALK